MVITEMQRREYERTHTVATTDVLVTCSDGFERLVRYDIIVGDPDILYGATEYDK